jgi:outer membrane protein OmpA-like peptidoglycan-associated protein
MISWRQLAALSGIFLLGACAQTQPQAQASYQSPAASSQPPVASNPPPVPPGPNAVWYHVSFDTNAVAIGPDGQSVVADVTTYLQGNPNAIATIIGRTDTVGSRDYNMHLSHQRADAVRDALVYRGNVAADRVETRWTGETRLKVATAGDVAEASNRVVDIAIH